MVSGKGSDLTQIAVMEWAALVSRILMSLQRGLVGDLVPWELWYEIGYSLDSPPA